MKTIKLLLAALFVFHVTPFVNAQVPLIRGVNKTVEEAHFFIKQAMDTSIETKQAINFSSACENCPKTLYIDNKTVIVLDNGTEKDASILKPNRTYKASLMSYPRNGNVITSIDLANNF